MMSMSLLSDRFRRFRQSDRPNRFRRINCYDEFIFVDIIAVVYGLTFFFSIMVHLQRQVTFILTAFVNKHGPTLAPCSHPSNEASWPSQARWQWPERLAECEAGC